MGSGGPTIGTPTLITKPARIRSVSGGKVPASGFDEPVVVSGLEGTLRSLADRQHQPFGVGKIDSYSLIKALHVLSATILFGTGLGIAFFFWSAGRSDDRARLFAARTTVRADFLFTLPAVVLQPITGAWLISKSGIDPRAPWIMISIALYILAGFCWLPVVWLQIKMKNMLESSLAGGAFDREAYEHLRKIWFLLGWPAFLGLIIVFWLMVAKPSW